MRPWLRWISVILIVVLGIVAVDLAERAHTYAVLRPQEQRRSSPEGSGAASSSTAPAHHPSHPVKHTRPIGSMWLDAPGEMEPGKDYDLSLYLSTGEDSPLCYWVDLFWGGVMIDQKRSRDWIGAQDFNVFSLGSDQYNWLICGLDCSSLETGEVLLATLRVRVLPEMPRRPAGLHGSPLCGGEWLPRIPGASSQGDWEDRERLRANFTPPIIRVKRP